jgi:hypothetical protein
MADTRRILRVNLDQDSYDLVERQRGSDTVSGFVAAIVEGDAKEPGAWEGTTHPVLGKDAVTTISVSIPSALVPGLDRRRENLSGPEYVSALLAEEAQLLKDGLASARGAQIVQEAQRRQGGATETSPRRKGHQGSKGTKGPSPRPKPRRRNGRPDEGTRARRRSHQQAAPPPQKAQLLAGGHSRVERRPRPRREIRLHPVPEDGWEVRTPSPTKTYLDELKAGLPAEQARLRAQRQAQAEQQAPASARPDKPASSTPASRVVEKLAPPPSPLASPSPSTHRGSQEPYTRPPEPFAAKDHPMNQIPPRRPPPGIGPRVIEKPQEQLDHGDLLALLQRHEAGLERFPALSIVAALDGEGGRAVHADLSTNLKGAGDALRVVIGVDEDLEVAPLVGPGVVEASWTRLLVMLESLASRLGCVINVTPHITAIPLEDSEDDSWDEDWEESEDDVQEAEVPSGYALLVAIQAESASGRLGAFPSSSMW